MNVNCRVCKGTGSMNLRICVGRTVGVHTAVPCTECGGTGIGGIRDWPAEKLAEALRGAMRVKYQPRSKP